MIQTLPFLRTQRIVVPWRSGKADAVAVVWKKEEEELVAVTVAEDDTALLKGAVVGSFPSDERQRPLAEDLANTWCTRLFILYKKAPPIVSSTPFDCSRLVSLMMTTLLSPRQNDFLDLEVQWFLVHEMCERYGTNVLSHFPNLRMIFWKFLSSTLINFNFVIG